MLESDTDNFQCLPGIKAQCDGNESCVARPYDRHANRRHSECAHMHTIQLYALRRYLSATLHR